jgi:hypothetical protein
LNRLALQIPPLAPYTAFDGGSTSLKLRGSVNRFSERTARSTWTFEGLRRLGTETAKRPFAGIGKPEPLKGNLNGVAMVHYELTQHARDVLEERRISVAWMERVLGNPALIQPSITDPDLENRFDKIAEFGDRVLRVVVNNKVVPERVVSVYFDRRMKGKL